MTRTARMAEIVIAIVTETVTERFLRGDCVSVEGGPRRIYKAIEETVKTSVLDFSILQTLQK